MAQGKKNLPVFKVADAVPILAPGTYTSLPTLTPTVDRFFLIMNFTGALTGTPFIEASVDYDPAKYPNSPGTWYSIPFVWTTLAGAPQDYVIDFTESSIKALRCGAVITGGAGDYTATIFGKES